MDTDRTGRILDGGTDADFPAVLRRDPHHLEVLIPARNEAGRLPRTLELTIKYLERQPYSAAVVVIDNGSFDQTTDIAVATRSRRVPVYVTGCARPGKGAAVRHGILGSQSDYVGYMDADFATPIDTLDVMVPLLLEYPAVVASRRIPGALFAKRQPLHRSAGSMVFHQLAHRILPDIIDTQCGFKFFAGELARKAAARLTVDGFAFDVEMLSTVCDLGGRIKEVPVVWTDSRGSSLNAFHDGTEATIELYRLMQRRRAT
ncbi:MAG TPA: glycosyltransferase [Trebonia sp.]